MAKVIIVKSLEHEILKKFKEESEKIFDLIHTLKDNPSKGKELGHVSGIVIKEIRYKSFRLYFITEGYRLKVMSKEELNDLLIRFVRMSDKKTQQKTIDEIKQVLRCLGEGGF
ncbi:hypothetical protein A3K82_02105 [Candidatus Pacearchaeota archaeon RBG_19FT_COMBO_34_9]|nr:MAG: hypothetical protein A3K82_02105 [Candidatus Pacearchaeota archaeon RBG_19FT_COMBO_34_9]